MNTLLPINSDTVQRCTVSRFQSSNTTTIQVLFGVFSMSVEDGGTHGMKWGRVRSIYQPQSCLSSLHTKERRMKYSPVDWRPFISTLTSSAAIIHLQLDLGKKIEIWTNVLKIKSKRETLISLWISNGNPSFSLIVWCRLQCEETSFAGV